MLFTVAGILFIFLKDLVCAGLTMFMRPTLTGARCCLLPRWLYARPIGAFVTWLIPALCVILCEHATNANSSELTPKAKKTSLEFSATPTVEEIFGAHVLDEPLVPVGVDPKPSENAALAS